MKPARFTLVALVDKRFYPRQRYSHPDNPNADYWVSRAVVAAVAFTLVGMFLAAEFGL